ncbi:adenosylcobinamide-GDP ribazoletransferase [Halolamina sp. C58]|uniref:adenosylcobinamide-GDP ribazoletransferase n=1 Tax=Halolamina sp. C58 TaxID=3421640 RepID=UPI003EB7C1C7
MALSALRGAVGFLTRLPVGGDATDWRAVTESPWAFPVVGVGTGLLLAAPVVALGGRSLPLLAAVGYLGLWVGLSGITHLDGVADLGDAAVVHGDAEARVAVLKDSEVGVGAVVALLLATLGTALAVASLAGGSRPLVAAVIVGAEVGAKAAMAALACLATARHEGLGAQFTEPNGPRDLLPVALVLVAAAGGVWFLVPAALPGATLTCAAALGGSWLLARWANGLLDGVNGDVFGAVDVAARLAGLVAGALLVGGGLP